MPMLNYVRDAFTGSAVRREARSEAISALRAHGAEAERHLQTRLARTQLPYRRQVYRLAITMLPKLAESLPATSID
jgi:hypothetical protein